MAAPPQTVSAVGRSVLYRIGAIAMAIVVALDVVALLAYLMSHR